MRRRFLLLLLTTTAWAGPTASITGVPTVTDGDTLQIRDTRIRLFGVDAPESSQQCVRGGVPYACGREAAFALADLIRGRNVTCQRQDTDRYGRMVGVCAVGGVEVNRWLVEQGWALPYLQYGGGVYREAEIRAKAARRGLHAGTYQNPWAYRRNPGNPPTAGTPRVAGNPASSSGVAYRTCAAARAAGVTPLRRGQPGYNLALDRDGDGVACE